MRFRIDSPAIPARRFVLPLDEHSTAPALPVEDQPVKAPVWGAGVARQTYKRPVQPVKAQAPKRRVRGLFTARAPVAARKGRRVLEFTAASEYQMAGFLGTIQLRINRDSVDLSRLELGLLSLAIDHDTTRLMGRVTEATIYSGRLDMLAEVGDTPTATNAMAEIDDLVRQGFSPGFLIHETETLSEGDPGYDESQMFQIVVTRWEAYEISTTAVPRSPDARLRGVASMGNVIAMDDGITGAPELVSTSDLIGLSLSAGREVLRSGGGSERQRAKLTEFFKVFETGLERGLSRDAAAAAAKAETGL